MQDATKCLMGSPGFLCDNSEFDQDPATFVAGVAVRLKSDGTLSVAKADGRLVGVSLGRSLSDFLATSVCRAGRRVPFLLEATPARGVVTITSFANLIATSGDTLQLGATTFTFQAGAATLGTTAVQAATSNNATAASLVAQINGHATAGALFIAAAVGAVVTITAKNNATVGSTVALIYTDVHGSDIGLTTDHATLTGTGAANADFVTIGAKVYISDTTGKADDPNSASTISNAIYVSGVLTGIDESGNSVAAALIDMQGGL